MSTTRTRFVVSVIIVIMGAVILFGSMIATVYGNSRSGKQLQEQQVDESERVETEIKEEKITFETETIEDDTVEYGKTIVRSEGSYGKKTLTYNVTYKGKKEISRELVSEQIVKQPVSRVVIKGVKIVWRCVDTTSYDRNPNNDNLCTSSTGEKIYVNDCKAVSLDPGYSPSQAGASRYNGCSR